MWWSMISCFVLRPAPQAPDKEAKGRDGAGGRCVHPRMAKAPEPPWTPRRHISWTQPNSSDTRLDTHLRRLNALLGALDTLTDTSKPNQMIGSIRLSILFLHIL
jgi:hypothetical protein